jgi:hypothetical protein
LSGEVAAGQADVSIYIHTVIMYLWMLIEYKPLPCLQILLNVLFRIAAVRGLLICCDFWLDMELDFVFTVVKM